MSPTPESPRSPVRTGPRTPAWWFRDNDGRRSVAMFPNPALWAFLATVALDWTGWVPALTATELTNVGRGALIVWALDELFRGASPFRRVLGAVVLAYQLVVLVS